MISFWQQKMIPEAFDYLIVGGGFTGLFTALMLKQKHAKASIAVADLSGGKNGASVRNAGFACFGSPSEVLYDVDIMGEEDAFGLFEKRWEGIRFLEKEFGQACEFQGVLGYEVFPSAKRALFEKCVESISSLNLKLKRITGLDKTYEVDNQNHGFSDLVHQIHIKGEGQLNPARLHSHLRELCSKAGVIFQDNFSAQSLSQAGQFWTVEGEQYSLGGQQVINCTNGFTNSWISMPHVLPARAQVLITKPLKKMPINGNFHMDEGFFYFRNVGNRLLLGGARNVDIKGETTTDLEVTTTIQDALEQVLQTHIFPNEEVEIEHRWSGIMGIRANKKPQVEMHDTRLWSIVGLSGMGVALAPMLAKELVEKL